MAPLRRAERENRGSSGPAPRDRRLWRPQSQPADGRPGVGDDRHLLTPSLVHSLDRAARRRYPVICRSTHSLTLAKPPPSVRLEIVNPVAPSSQTRRYGVIHALLGRGGVRVHAGGRLLADRLGAVPTKEVDRFELAVEARHHRPRRRRPRPPNPGAPIADVIAWITAWEPADVAASHGHRDGTKFTWRQCRIHHPVRSRRARRCRATAVSRCAWCS